MLEKLEEWFGVTIDEYPSMGHELDVFSVSSQGRKLLKNGNNFTKYFQKQLTA
jgi:hypothetical protein